jgi:hypothetical protein
MGRYKTIRYKTYHHTKWVTKRIVTKHIMTQNGSLQNELFQNIPLHHIWQKTYQIRECAPDGERVVHKHVAQQDGAEQEVTHPSQRHDRLHKTRELGTKSLFRYLLLLFVTVIRYHYSLVTFMFWTVRGTV